MSGAFDVWAGPERGREKVLVNLKFYAEKHRPAACLPCCATSLASANVSERISNSRAAPVNHSRQDAYPTSPDRDGCHPPM